MNGRQELTDMIIQLVKTAQQHTGASTAAALVLLSAYDSHHFALPIAELGTLDLNNFKAAQHVISARYQGFEPHIFIKDGGKIFETLRRDWNHLAISANSPYHTHSKAA